MAITISVVLVFGVAAWVLYRYGGMKLWHGLVCIAFGFYLATSSVAPTIRSVGTSVLSSFSHHG